MARKQSRRQVTCRSCGATLSWRIVRDLTSSQDDPGTAYCPACRSPLQAEAGMSQ